MERDTAIGIKYYLSLANNSSDLLRGVYQWEHLSMATDGDLIWIKGLSEEDLTSTAVLSIPGINRYYSKLGRLYPYGKLLPVGYEPSLLWTAMKKAIFLDLPSKNHNLFDVSSDIEVKLIAAAEEHVSSMMMTDLDNLYEYVHRGSSIRMKPLLWTIVGSKALLIGSPLLPIPGETFWKIGNHILPAGYEFELPIIAEQLDTMINPGRKYDILWSPSCSYSLIDKSLYTSLSRSSVRATRKVITNDLSHDDD